jgi:hypothetical protein
MIIGFYLRFFLGRFCDILKLKSLTEDGPLFFILPIILDKIIITCYTLNIRRYLTNE